MGMRKAPSSTTSGTVTTPGTPGGDPVADYRDRIDALDEAIINLSVERINASKAVQRVKRARGLTLVDVAREKEIMRRYEDALGLEGREIATLLLKLAKS